MRIKTFMQFESKKLADVLYRNCSLDELKKLLAAGEVKPIKKEFLSLSEDPDSGGQDSYGDVRLILSKEKILNRDGLYVDYENPEFFDRHPDIAKHVTGWYNEKEYYDQIGYSDAEETNANNELGWEDYCESFSDEEEIVTKCIKLSDLVEVSGNLDLTTKANLEKHNIPFS